MIPLGDPGLDFAGAVETPVILIEAGPNTWAFELAPYLGQGFEIHNQDGEVPTAEVDVNLAEPGEAA